MTCSRLIVTLAGITLAISLTGNLLAQEEQENNYNGDAGDNLFDTSGNWDQGGPSTWAEDPVGTYDLNSGGISFDLAEDMAYTITVGGNAYENITNLHLLSRSAITLDGQGTNTYFKFDDDGEIRTGDGALYLMNIDLELGGNFTFNYGNEDSDDPAMTISASVSSQSLEFNLIIDGEINDGEGGFGDETLTFAGDGFALLNGGIRGGHTGEDGDEDPTVWKLAMNEAASLMLAGSSTYYLGGGVEMNYSAGSASARGDGHGILQVTDGATLNTTDDGEESTSGNIDLNGWSALLIGQIDLADADTMEELEDLGFDVDDSTSTIGHSTGSGDVITDTMTLNGDSVVVVGTDGSITGEELEVTGSSTFMVQQGATHVEFEQLSTAEAGRLINYGTISVTDDSDEYSVTNAGTIINGGSITIAAGFANTGTLEMTGGSMNITQNAAFSGETKLTGGSITAQASFGLDGTMTIEGVGSTINAGTYASGDLDSIELNGNLTITDGSFNSNGNTAIGGQVYIDGGNFRVGTVGEDEMTFSLEGAGRFGGYGTLENNAENGLTVGNGTLFVGEWDGTDPSAANSLTVHGDVFIQNGDLEFAIEVDSEGMQTGGDSAYEDSDGRAVYMHMEDGKAHFTGNSTLRIGVTGDNYIPNGTQFFLVDSTEDWSDLDTLELHEASNSVTRYFEILDKAGYIEMTSDYISNAGAYGALGNWLQNDAAPAGGAGSALAHQFDQLSTASAYQYALRQLQPVTLSAGLQIVSDTQQFGVLREAVSGLTTQRTQGQPGPARRPLGQMSESLLASQDEGDAVRSRYGYGIGPEAGARRSENSDIVAFAQGYGRWVDLDNKGGVLGLNGNEWGIIGGAAANLSDDWMLGLLIGYDSFDGTLNDNGGSVDVKTVRVGPFVNWSDGSWIVDASIAGAWNDWNGTQNTGLAATPSYDWNTQGYQIDGSAGLGYAIPVGGGVDIIPEGSIVYSWIHTDGYTGSTGIAVDTDDLNAIIGRLGARAQFNVISGLILEGRAGWQGNYTFGGDISTTYQNVATPIPSTLDAVDRNTIYYGGQVTWMPEWNLALTLRYEGRSGDGTDDQYIAGGFSLEF